MKAPVYARGSFNTFCTTYYRGEDCLADYIAAWLVQGEGMEICNGDRETFLEIVILITTEWMHDPDLLSFDPNPSSDEPSYISRSVSDVLGQSWVHHPILDPNWFKQVKRQKRS